MQLKLDMSCHPLNVYTKFQIDISKHVEEKSGKPEQTDGRTDIATAQYVRFSNGCIKSIEIRENDFKFVKMIIIVMMNIDNERSLKFRSVIHKKIVEFRIRFRIDQIPG